MPYAPYKYVLIQVYYRLFVDSNPDTLKSKKSELRLYCDLLMQQVHMVKTAVTQEGGPEVQVRLCSVASQILFVDICLVKIKLFPIYRNWTKQLACWVLPVIHLLELWKTV